MRPAGVFLVDDSPLVREGIRPLLESDGNIVVVGEAGSAQKIFTKVNAQAVDVVLLEIGLAVEMGSRSPAGSRSSIPTAM